MKPWKIVGLAIALACTMSAVPPAQAQVTGAGSTFAQLILTEWSHAYQRADSDKEYQPVGSALDYEPIGSQGGILRVRDAAVAFGSSERPVDFGATDVPLPSAELEKLGLAQFPFVIGGIVAVVNLPGVASGELKLTGEVLADIFQAKVTRWSDPAIATLNPGLALPEAQIAVVHRSDGSGTTFNFTNFLSTYSPGWKADIGHDLEVRWPAGYGAKGGQGVAETVRATQNAIGYVDFAQAERAGLAHALIRNRAGAFPKPGIPSFQAAASSAAWAAPPDFDLLLTDAPGAEAYPLVATVFALMPKRTTTPRRTAAALDFFRWSLDNGASAAARLGYVALPAELVGQVQAYWAANITR